MTNHPFNALKIAMQFLTRLPMKHADYNERDVKYSIYWYGCVGLIIGLCLAISKAAALWFAPYLDSMITASLLLCLWVLITGGLHLDGLADSADAWLGGQNSEHTLEIMKDPRCGPAGVISIVLLLLIKFACLNALVPQSGWLVLLAPATARAVLPVLFLHTPYVRQAGLASPFREGLSQRACYLSALPIVLLWIGLLGWHALPALLVIVLAYRVLRKLMLKRIEGTTGDTAGAMVEILEAVVLIVIAVILAN